MRPTRGEEPLVTHYRPRHCFSGLAVVAAPRGAPGPHDCCLRVRPGTPSGLGTGPCTEQKSKNMVEGMNE
ncbi:Hypothetical predicted protein [Lynx pardinus]|uniref:Uncharacterized protein n=1 Tax=Lynx pardinus TaxID=191816 RepID=A0A485MAG9_LYNPA|nr:Hypothetical predicted protein [Lynx pardinus]